MKQENNKSPLNLNVCVWKFSPGTQVIKIHNWTRLQYSTNWQQTPFELKITNRSKKKWLSDFKVNQHRQGRPNVTSERIALTIIFLFYQLTIIFYNTEFITFFSDAGIIFSVYICANTLFWRVSSKIVPFNLFPEKSGRPSPSGIRPPADPKGAPFVLFWISQWRIFFQKNYLEPKKKFFFCFFSFC